MAVGFTLMRLTEVEDAAANAGIGDRQEARSASGALELEQVGVTFHRVKPRMRQAFGHRHGEVEECYVVVGGSGRVKLGDDVVEVGRLDAVRVAPGVIRAFEGGPDGLEYIAFGPQRDDAEVLPDWWE